MQQLTFRSAVRSSSSGRRVSGWARSSPLLPSWGTHCCTAPACCCGAICCGHGSPVASAGQRTRTCDQAARGEFARMAHRPFTFAFRRSETAPQRHFMQLCSIPGLLLVPFGASRRARPGVRCSGQQQPSWQALASATGTAIGLHERLRTLQLRDRYRIIWASGPVRSWHEDCKAAERHGRLVEAPHKPSGNKTYQSEISPRDWTGLLCVIAKACSAAAGACCYQG